MADIIYPILQKYYNALNSLKSLNVTRDTFESIPLIDNFFAEFRNITFVMQKTPFFFRAHSRADKDGRERTGGRGAREFRKKKRRSIAPRRSTFP